MNYKIEGGSLPVVICTLDAGETMITEMQFVPLFPQGINKRKAARQ